MAQFNPIVGGPAYLEMLGATLSAWELKSPYASMAPAAGGVQLSIRLAKDRVALLDAIATRSNWNRNQVLVALLERSLYELFERLPDRTAEQLRDDMIASLFPPSE